MLRLHQVNKRDFPLNIFNYEFKNLHFQYKRYMQQRQNASTKRIVR
jgi:hypothetical protein